MTAVTAGAAQSPPRPGRRWTRHLLPVAAGLAILYLFVPIFVIVLFSFNKPRGKFNIVWQSFTLENWAHPFIKQDLTDAMLLSLRVALIACTLATILGALIAIALCRYRFRGGRAIDLLLVLPLTTPEIVLGSSLAALFINRGVDRGFWTIVIAHTMFCVSFVALTVKARISGFDWSLEDAAMDLGARPWRTFRKVTLPLIVPGILAAFLLSFALSIDDFIITLFNSGSDNTFPIQIYGASRVELAPQINVLASIVLFASVGVMLAGTVFGRRKKRAT